MKVDYLDDLHIPSLGEWPSSTVGDWLHPLHGPLPDHLGLLEYAKVEFMAAIWECSNSLVVMLEQLENEDPDPRVPMRHIDDVYIMRGWITQTYLWEITTARIKYGNYEIIPDPDTHNPEWRRNTYRRVMIESIKVCADFPGGFYGA
jgi:hypothetical protein